MTQEMPHTAMILSAGFGTRMRPLTDRTPKPLLKVAGKSLIDHTLDLLSKAGVRRAVVNLHYLGDQIRRHLSNRSDLEIVFSNEQPEILDTGGGVVNALPQLGDDPFIVINSDALWLGSNPIASLVRAWSANRFDGLLLLIPRDRTINYTRPGDFFLDHAAMIPLRRGSSETAPFVFTGAQILKPSVFAKEQARPFSLNLIWDRLIATKRLGAVVYDGRWIDVGTPEGLEIASGILQTSRGDAG